MRLGWVILYVPDMPAAVGFYERAFGLTRRFVAPGDEFAEMETGATALAFAAEDLVRRGGIEFRPSRPVDMPLAAEVALVTDTVDEAYRAAVAAGAVALTEPAEKPWGQRVAYVRDLNGVIVEIAAPLTA